MDSQTAPTVHNDLRKLRSAARRALIAERDCAQLSLRYTLNVLLASEGAPFSRTRHTVLTVGIVASSLAVALAVPDLAEKIFAVTGATGAPAYCSASRIRVV